MENQNEQQRDFKGIWISADIWLDKRLNALDKIILMEINSLDNNESGCYASNKYLAEFCQCTETKISTSISKLKELGYVYQQSFDGRHRILKTEMQPLKNLKADIKNFKANNIDNNKEKINNNIINEDFSKSENSKPKKELTEKQKQAIERNKILEDFIKDEDDDIKQALKDYVNVRKTKGLQPNQLQIILEDFEKEYKNKSKEAILEQIRKATAGGWLQLVYVNKFSGNVKTSYSSNYYQDNTANHNTGNESITDEEFNKMDFQKQVDYLNNMEMKEMTKYQRQFFREHCLAHDENGNLLEF